MSAAFRTRLPTSSEVGRRPRLIARSPKLSNQQRSQVKRLINSSNELKQFPVYQTNTITTAMTTTRFMNIAEGDGISERSGLKVIPKSIELDYEVTAADATNKVRVMLIRWIPNTSDDGVDESEVFYNPVGLTQRPLNPLVIEKSQRKKFVVLYDRIHYLNTVSKPNELGRIRVYNTSKKTKLPPIYYNDGTSTAGRKNGYELVTMSDSAGPSHPGIVYAGAIKYFAP